MGANMFIQSALMGKSFATIMTDKLIGPTFNMNEIMPLESVGLTK